MRAAINLTIQLVKFRFEICISKVVVAVAVAIAVAVAVAVWLKVDWPVRGWVRWLIWSVG